MYQDRLVATLDDTPHLVVVFIGGLGTNSIQLPRDIAWQGVPANSILRGRAIDQKFNRIEDQRQDPCIRLGQQVHGQKPFIQWQLGSCENGATGQRRLLVTTMTLMELSALQFAMMGRMGVATT